MTDDKTPEQIAHEIGLLLAGQQIGTVAQALSMSLAHFAYYSGTDPQQAVERISRAALQALGIPAFDPADLSTDRTIN